MSAVPQILPDDPALLKALIAALQAENAKISATLRAHDQLIQALRLRIARLKKQVFGQSSEKIEREIERKRCKEPRKVRSPFNRAACLSCGIHIGGATLSR